MCWLLWHRQLHRRKRRRKKHELRNMSQMSTQKMVETDCGSGCTMTKSGVCFYNADFIVICDALAQHQSERENLMA